jgi:hypothetical protein
MVYLCLVSCRLIGSDSCLNFISVGVIVGQSCINLRQGKMADFGYDFLGVQP